jgi:hypothetical protein
MPAVFFGLVVARIEDPCGVQAALAVDSLQKTEKTANSAILRAVSVAALG